jgi:ABC-type antimicrobial peptide transport system permease subunit
MPAFDVSSMEQRLSDALARRRFSMFLLGVFSAAAAVLAAAGIYGVISYWVNYRTHEIGIRMALGAQQRDIQHLVIRQALLLVSLGMAVGIAGAFVMTRLLSSLLFGVSATDRLTFVIAPPLLGGIALLAGYLPARRAARVDPIIALHHE